MILTRLLRGTWELIPPMYRRILALASPVVAAMISQTLINQADHILVGRLPAEESVPGQAALQVSVILLWAIGGTLSAISVGTQALTARRLGEGNDREAGTVLTNSLSISVTLGLFSSILFWFLAPILLPVINKDPQVVALGVPFLQWRYLQVMSMVVTASYKSFFDGLGKTWVHMVVAIIMNIVNFVLNVALIYGKWGFPRMGVPGSGLASCISSYLGMFLMIAWSLRPVMRQRFQYYRWSALKKSLASEIARLSWPSSVAGLFAMSGFGVFMKIVAKLDETTGRAGFTVYSTATANIINIFMLVFISCIAYGTATSTLVGQNMGASQFDRAESYVWKSAKLGFGIFAVLGILTFLFPGPILHVFSKDQAVIDVAQPILKILGLFEPFACLALVFTYALYGAGNSRFVMIVEGTLHFTCLIPAAYLLGPLLGLGIMGMWIAMIAYVVLMAGIMIAKFSTGSWKEIRI